MPIDGDTRFIALIGHPVAQVRSLGPMNRAFAAAGANLAMLPVDIAPSVLPFLFAALRGMANCVGLSVTVPHKQAAARLCDELSGRAREVGAVNTIRRDPDGKLHGDMTDGQAFVAALTGEGIAVPGRRCLLVGCGGAGTAIAFALAEAGVRSLALVDPNGARRAALADALGRRFPGLVAGDGAMPSADIDLAVNATPLGMAPDDALPLDVDGLGPTCVVADVVTKPAVTPLLTAARARGLAALTGVAMAEAQPPFQLAHWGLAEAILPASGKAAP